MREVLALQDEAGLPVVTDGEFRRRLWYHTVLAVATASTPSASSASTPTREGRASRATAGRWWSSPLRAQGQPGRRRARLRARRTTVAAGQGDDARARATSSATGPRASPTAPTRAARRSSTTSIALMNEDARALAAAGASVPADRRAEVHVLHRRRLYPDPDRLAEQLAEHVRTDLRVLRGRRGRDHRHARLPRQLPRHVRLAARRTRSSPRRCSPRPATTGCCSSTTTPAPAASSRCASCRDDVTVVLGLVTTKTPELEDARRPAPRTSTRRRAFVPLERLALSTQCGFASAYEGNEIGFDDQRRKLELVVAHGRGGVGQCGRADLDCPPMLLVVDVGNTQTHFGTFRGDDLVEHWRFATVRDVHGRRAGRRAAQPARAARGDASATSTPRSSPRTVPQLGPEWSTMASRYLGHEMLVVGPGIRTGMAIRYDNPREIGADRLVNAVAAYETVRRRLRSCVDFGTAMTFDIVSADGEYLGGIIAPGVEISHRGADRARRHAAADRHRAAALADRQVDGRRDPQRHRLRLRRAVDGIVAPAAGRARRARPRRSPRAGWPRRSCRSRETIDEVDDLLTLTGLRLICGAQPIAIGLHWERGRAPLTDPFATRRERDPQPRRARAAGGHRQLVRAPAGQALRRRAGRVGDGLELRDPPRQREDVGEMLRIHPDERAATRAGRRSSSSARTRTSCARPRRRSPRRTPTSST